MSKDALERETPRIGKVPFDSESKRMTTVHRASNDKTVAYVKDLQAKTTTWNATVNNCNAFVGNIARSMGYKVPGIWLRPQQFVTRLREMATES